MKLKAPSIPKDLKVKIGTKNEVLWTNVLKNAKEVLRQAEEQIILQKAIIDMAQAKIVVEKGKI